MIAADSALNVLKGALIFMSVSYVGSQVWAAWALGRARKRLAAQALAAERLPAYPPISVITSLKGPTPGAAEAVRSLLRQDYPGELEIVFAAKDRREPLLAEIARVCLECPTRAKVKWVYPVDVEGLNPRTAKIAKAFEAASSPWIFGTTVDTRFAPGFLRRAMELARAEPDAFVTSFPAIDRPAEFSATLEAVGLNVDVAEYFLFTSMAGGACAYGGAMLFSRELLAKAGGFRAVVRLLTDDVTLARAFSRAGGRCLLTADLAYVRQERHSFREYWTRQVRWRMIARYFLPSLYWLAPLSWVNLYLAIGALAFQSAALAAGFAAVTLSRMAVGISVQRTLDTPRADWLKACALPIYDWIAIAAQFAAFFQRGVRWGTTFMRLDADGAVIATVAVAPAGIEQSAPAFRDSRRVEA